MWMCVPPQHIHTSDGPSHPRLASPLLIPRTVLGAEPLWALQTRPRDLGGLEEVALSSLPPGNPSSGCKWSEEEFLHRQKDDDGEEEGPCARHSLTPSSRGCRYFPHLAHKATETQKD